MKTRGDVLKNIITELKSADTEDELYSVASDLANILNHSSMTEMCGYLGRCYEIFLEPSQKENMLKFVSYLLTYLDDHEMVRLQAESRDLVRIKDILAKLEEVTGNAWEVAIDQRAGNVFGYRTISGPFVVVGVWRNSAALYLKLTDELNKIKRNKS